MNFQAKTSSMERAIYFWVGVATVTVFWGSLCRSRFFVMRRTKPYWIIALMGFLRHSQCSGWCVFNFQYLKTQKRRTCNHHSCTFLLLYTTSVALGLVIPRQVAQIALAVPAVSLPMKSQFFAPNLVGRIPFSMRLLSISSCPFLKQDSSLLHCPRA